VDAGTPTEVRAPVVRFVFVLMHRHKSEWAWLLGLDVKLEVRDTSLNRDVYCWYRIPPNRRFIPGPAS
jgi:hypothetical protein